MSWVQRPRTQRTPPDVQNCRSLRPPRGSGSDAPRGGLYSEDGDMEVAMFSELVPFESNPGEKRIFVTDNGK